MAVPVLAIGIGGTGKQVLLRFKERLLETYGGVVPKEVVLLEIDTEEPAENFCGVTLNPGTTGGRMEEFVSIATRANMSMDEVFEEARQGKPEWGWLEVDTLDRVLGPAARNINNGAGQRRPIGRTALFLNYHTVRSQIATALNQMYSAAAGDQNLQQRLAAAGKKETLKEGEVQEVQKKVVFIVGSVAGGTGSGILLDVAYILKDMQEVDQRFRTITTVGVIVLPGVFVPPEKMANPGKQNANSFAALREIDRFMRAHSEQVPYHMSLPGDVRVRWTKRLMDICYLVDIQTYQSGAQPGGGRGEYGVFPTIADFMAAHVDDVLAFELAKTRANTEAKFMAPKPEKGEAERKLFSSLGTYTLIFPREDVIKSCGYDFLLEILDTHLITRRGDGLAVPAVPVDAETFVDTNLAKDQNVVPEVNNVPFIKRLVTSTQRGRMAQGIELELGSVLAWAVPDPTAAAAMQKNIENSMRQLQKATPANKGDHRSWLSSVEGWEHNYLGPRLQPNLPEREGGKWDEWFSGIVNLYRHQFADMLDRMITKLLNERDKDGLLLPNRLAYTKEILSILKGRVKLFKDMVTAAYGRPDQKITATRDELNESALRLGKRPGIFDTTESRGKAYVAKRYELAQYELDFRLQKLILNICDALGGTITGVGEIPSVIDVATARLNTWVDTLKEVRSDIAGRRQLHETYRDDKQKIAVRRYIRDAKLEKKLYDRYQPEARVKVLGTVEGQAGLDWEHVGGKESEYFDYKIVTHVFRQATGVKDIADAWVEGSLGIPGNEQYPGFFSAIRRDSDTDMAKLAYEFSAKNPDHFVNELYRKQAESLVVARGGVDTKITTERFVGIRAASEDSAIRTFFAGIENAIKPGTLFDNVAYTQETESQVACTILETMHGLLLERFSKYVDNETAYRNELKGEGGLHLFWEEINSAEYETAIPSLKEAALRPHGFHPEVTVTLGDKTKVEGFVMAHLHGVLHEGEYADPTTNRLTRELFLPSGGDKVRLTDNAKIERLSQLDPATQSMMLLLKGLQTFTLVGTDIATQYKVIDIAEVNAAWQAAWRAKKEELRTQVQADMQSRNQPITATAEQVKLREAVEKYVKDFIARQLGPMKQSKDQRIKDLGIVMQLIITQWLPVAQAG